MRCGARIARLRLCRRGVHKWTGACGWGSYRTGAGDDMLLALLRGRTSYKLQSYLQTSRRRSRAAGGGMIGKSKGARTMAWPRSSMSPRLRRGGSEQQQQQQYLCVYSAAHRRTGWVI